MRKPIVFGLSLSVAAALAVGAGPASADSTIRSVSIESPTTNATTAVGPMDVTGVIGGGKQATVVFAVDVSGSTSYDWGLDCNGDGTPGNSLDDFNQQGAKGDVLDCEIAGVVALNASLRAIPGAADRVRTGLVAFGDSAVAADVNPGDPYEKLVAPGATGGGTDVIPYLNSVASSLTQGSVGRFTYGYAGTGTDFDEALTAALPLFKDVTGSKYIFFLSDGEASTPDMTAAKAAGIKVRTFAVNQTSCNSALNTIAQATGETCAAVADPSKLAAKIQEPDSEIRGVSVELTPRAPNSATALRQAATIDALGNYKASFPYVSSGLWRATSTLTMTDGSTATATADFRSTSGLKYVALGDSYSSGEGNPLFFDQLTDDGNKATFHLTQAFVCHRSQAGWPTKVRWSGQTSPISITDPDLFDFRACSGARIVNADTTPQRSSWGICPQPGTVNDPCENPLQLKSLGSDTDLVTLSMGGNDIGFVPIIVHCASHIHCYKDTFVSYKGAGGAKVDIPLEQWANIRLALMQNELRGLYASIRQRVRPDTTVVAATYPVLLDDDPAFRCAEKLALPGDEREWLSNQVNAFDDRLEQVAGEATLGVKVADVRDKWGAENSVCGDQPWLYGISKTRPTDVGNPPTSAASMHPNGLGMQAYADAVNEAISSSNRLALSSPTRRGWKKALAKQSREELRQLTEEFSPELVSAVQNTTFADVVVGDAVASKGLPSCNATVAPNENVPFRAAGFAPGSSVQATWEWEGGSGSAKGLRADAQGSVSSTLVVPPSAKGTLSLTVEGLNTAQGTALGYGSTGFSASKACVKNVKAAKAREQAPSTVSLTRVGKKKALRVDVRPTGKRRVVLQRKAAGGWKAAAKRRTNAKGTAVVRTPKSGSYRVTVTKKPGYAKATSRAVRIR